MRNIFEYYNNFEKYSKTKSILLWGNPGIVKEPDVSILIPCFSHPDYLLTSLKSAIEQDYDGTYEIIISDNNDLDGTKNGNQELVESINDKRVLYYRNEQNIGIFGNWNRLVELARSPFVVYLHDDDFLLPNCLTTLMSIQKKYNADGVNAYHWEADKNGKITKKVEFIKTKKFGLRTSWETEKSTSFDLFMGRKGGYGCGCLFKKQCLKEIGGFSEDFYPSADYALNAVMATKYNVYFSYVPTFVYRIAENESLSVYNQFKDVDKHFRECLRDYIKIPNWILNRIILAQYRHSALFFRVLWGKESKDILKQDKFEDKFILWFFNKICRCLTIFNHNLKYKE